MYVSRLLVAWSLTWTVVPMLTTSVPTLSRVDHGRGAQLLLELGDLRLEHRLLVLGVVVLGVLGDVAELARLLDARGDLAALLRREVLELALELLETVRREDDVLGHERDLEPCEGGRDGPTGRRKQNPARGGDPASRARRRASIAAAQRPPDAPATSAARARRSRAPRAPRRSTACAGAVLQRPSLAQPRDVPGVELAQVAGGAALAEVLDGAVEHPVELGEDLLARRLVLARAEHLLEDPRVAERAAREQDRLGAGALEHLVTLAASLSPPEISTGTGSSSTSWRTRS